MYLDESNKLNELNEVKESNESKIKYNEDQVHNSFSSFLSNDEFESIIR